MTRAALLVTTVLGLFLAPTPSPGQTTFGVIEGRVVDATGAALPGATVSAVHQKTAVQRTSVTNEQGLYRTLNLNPGDYDVVVEMPGFESRKFQTVKVDIGQTVVLNVTLSIEGLAESLTVTASASLVNTVNAEISNTIGTKSVNETPLNGREFTRLALFAPGVSVASASVASIVINGSSSAQNNFLLDGIDATRVDASYQANGFERGAKLQTASVESIEEFRVLTTNYSAEYGRATGGVITAITKSGGNRLRGSAFGFLRNDRFDARNYFDPPRKPPFDLKQFGGSLGGPIKKDRVFFFNSYEGSRKDLGSTVSGTVPTAAFRSRVAPALAPILASIPLPTEATANPDIGLVRYSENTHVREDIYSARVDANLSPKDTVFIRYNLQDSEVKSPLWMVWSAMFAGQQQRVPQRTQSFTTSYSRFIRPNLMNEAKFGLNQFASEMHYTDPNSPQFIPRTTITGVAVTPGLQRPEFETATSLEFIDNVSWYRGVHSVRAGFNIRRVTMDLAIDGEETLVFPSMADFAANRPSQATSNPQIAETSMGNWQHSYYIQDNIKLSNRMTLNAGVRYDYGTVHTDTEHRMLNFDVGSMSIAGLDARLYNPDRNNFAPRIGVTYDLRGDGRTVLRGGYGVFYILYPVGSAGFLLTANAPGATLLTRTQVSDLQYPVASFANGVVNPPTRRALDPDRKDNFTHQTTLNLQQQLGANMAVTVGYVGSWNYNNERTRPLNLIDPATRRRPDTRYSQITFAEASGRSAYHALQTSFTRRMAQGLALNVNYTYSRMKDDIVSPQNPFASWDEEWALGARDIPHNFSLNAAYELPFGAGKRWANAGGLASTLLGGWQLSSVLLARSGTPYSVTLGSVTRSGTGYTTNQRPNVVPGVDHKGDTSGVNGWLNLAAFSDPATGTFGNLGRNTERGPNFVQFDMSLIKNTKLGGGSTNLQLRIEAFNVINRVQLPGSPTANILAPATFGNFYSTFGRTEGYGTSRQVQFAMRFTF